MPTIPLTPGAPGPDLPTLSHLHSYGALINVFRMALWSPQIAEGMAVLGAAQFAHSSLTPVDREMAILAVGALYESEYEAAQHEPISRSVGVTDHQRDAIAQRRWDDPGLTEAQQAMLQFVAAVVAAPTVPQEALDRIRLHYSDRQVVELVIQGGYYYLLGRITTVLDVPIDAPSDTRVLDAGVSAASQN